ncbi:hypothetical protein KAR91_72340 [Candidatus Pacearchaeota archaeon]|nr:hypothetical protein [Candidatus Pacearchaeota archaeon]
MSVVQMQTYCQYALILDEQQNRNLSVAAEVACEHPDDFFARMLDELFRELTNANFHQACRDAVL